MRVAGVVLLDTPVLEVVARLLVVRHRQSTWNAERRWAGQSNPPLSAQGVTEADEMAMALCRFSFGGIVSSDLLRARHTAEAIATRYPLARFLLDPRLRERDVPEWSGLTRVEIEERWPGIMAAWKMDDRLGLAGAEPWADVEKRVTEALSEAATLPPPVLIVTHSGVLRVLRTAFGAVELPTRSRGMWLEMENGRLQAGSLERIRPPGS